MAKVDWISWKTEKEEIINPEKIHEELTTICSELKNNLDKVVKNKLVEEMNHHHVHTLLVSPLKQDALTNNPVMVDRLMNAGVKIYMLNSAVAWDGKSNIASTQLKEVEIEDLLPREEIHVDLEAVEKLLNWNNN